MYGEFPYYLIEIMVEDYNIPKNELKILFDVFLRDGILNQVGENLYKSNPNS
ncbi:hypothetical protein LCGC14_2013930 [marine sediment metagenome]|uniref:Uncharacterized protein n=1 Tax=marine sediment metagenome TaxID=412755 RepID=A0A0F9EZM6_9ZZZZ